MKHFSILLLAAAFLPLVSCGPHRVTSTSYVNTSITSEPSGATVIFNGKVLGTTPCVVSMPVKITTVMNQRNLKNINTVSNTAPWEMQFTKDGVIENTTFDPNAVPLNNGIATINYKFKSFTRPSAYEKDPTIMAGEANNMVTRDNPGQTALERTVIRWYFDSDPQGARVYWRVVSSIPSIVKNTNETYLGTTPYEDTRAFNILGLTYENSRDVQIEIKIRRQGYMEQVKRFNVRQAIDQQEISSFYELVKEEE